MKGRVTAIAFIVALAIPAAAGAVELDNAGVPLLYQAFADHPGSTVPSTGLKAVASATTTSIERSKPNGKTRVITVPNRLKWGDIDLKR
jgi:hypothetical protein